MAVAGADADALGVQGNPLFLVTHFEYVTANNNGDSEYGQVPMTMGLTTIDQDAATGALDVVRYRNIDFSSVNGLWIPCASSLSPWNTHLGSEEYEPNARAYELDNSKDPKVPFTDRYFGSTQVASPYFYGITPEVTVAADGATSVVKHYALGRIARELAQVMPDNRTVYMGDDGSYVGLFMFVADTAEDLSAGRLYAARWSQLTDTNGGSADLSWVNLGHATDSEIKVQVDGGIVFSDIFLAVDSDPSDASYTRVKTNSGTEWLKLQPGMEQAAAFLETRRYAAYLGATTEFNKMEGVTVNARDHKVYIAMSYVQKGMLDSGSDPVNDIHVAEIKAGVVYQLDLVAAQSDTDATVINSTYVANMMSGLIAGEAIATDAIGNTANNDKIANPDNIKFSEKMRTLFIGEDSGMHVNNYVWAYNVDTDELARILSVPAGAEATGLQAVDDLNGFAYVMSNFQHPGDYISTTSAAVVSQVDGLINQMWNDKKKGAVGYLSGIPVIK
jgi:secreted PhoX family phosphatase